MKTIAAGGPAIGPADSQPPLVGDSLIGEAGPPGAVLRCPAAGAGQSVAGAARPVGPGPVGNGGGRRGAQGTGGRRLVVDDVDRAARPVEGGGRGPLAGLALFVYRRPALGVEVTGDEGLLDLWLTRTGFWLR
ncbi:hypothetical protein [Nocardiopsis composta]|uniref:Uncharacterized protein n=1 Tax=Nocardiopsis composta TaxID=157465 RepID=A0A7W8QHB3_9ACTN|nr:hypothetical protein [Nocardiopsis composta]MBB5430447.1 hypothetical protein [Nocardiopsis composta]